MKKILLIFFLVILFPITINAEINDSKLEQKYIGNIYSVFKMSNGEYYLYLQDLFIMNGKTAYCIEPNVHITTSIYSSTSNFNELNLSEEIKDKIKLIAYYGYDYFNKSDIKYFLAAQELIWETVLDGRGEVYWTSVDQVHGPRIDVEAEKNAILEKVNKDSLLPSFNNNSYDFKKGDNIIIQDTNSVLNDYKIIDSSNSYIEDNKLYVKEEKQIINLVRNNYTDEIFMFYYAGSSQKFLTSGFLTDKKASVYIKVHSGKIKINKVGETVFIENGFNYEQITLEEVKFHLIVDSPIIINDEVIYEKGDVVGVYQTDKNGNVIIDNLYFGKYILKEVSSSMGNIIDNDSYSIELTYNINNLNLSEHTVNLKNRLPKGELEILKIDADNKNKLPNTTFQLYSIDNKFIMELTTNEEGKILVSNIPLGKYYLVETKVNDGYTLKNERIYFDVKEDKEIISLTIENEPIIEVPNTSLNKKYYNIIAVILSLFLGILLVVYDKKNRFNINISK